MIIGVSGPKGCGKDTVYCIIKKFCGAKCHRVAFADPIRKMASKILKIHDNDVDVFKRCDVTMQFGDKTMSAPGRHIYREIGMLMRSYDPEQFIRYVDDVVSSGTSEDVWVITDVRFPNEVEYVRNKGGVIILVERDGCTYDHHPSEQLISHYDYKIINTSMDELTKNVFDVLKKLSVV